MVKVPPLIPSVLFTDKRGILTKDAYDYLFAVFNRIGGISGGPDASSLLGATWDSPAAIGAVAPSTGKFTSFACNGKAPQVSYNVGAAVATTGATNAAPFGFTTAAQANDIIVKLNAVITALKNNGIIV